MLKTNTEYLCDFLAGLKYEDIPEPVIEQAKKIMLHCFGASIAAAPLEQTVKSIRLSQAKGGREEATIWCSDGKKVPMEDAAFANGTIADILDWEDCSWTGHPSAGVIPTVLAVGEAKNLSGRDVLTAVVGAYECYQRVAMAAQPSKEYLLTGKGWGILCYQIFSAAFAAAKLYGFDSRKINQAMGAAMYQATLPSNKYGFTDNKSDIYHYAHGFAAKNGILSSRITEIGYENCYNALDGADGFWHMCSDIDNAEWYSRNLGSEWLIEQTLLKHWPANVWVQIALDCFAEMVAEHGLTLKNVKSFSVMPNFPFLMAPYSETTKSFLDSQFSFAYCMGVYLKQPVPDANWYSEQMRNDPEIVNFTTRFSTYGEPIGFNDNFDQFKAGDFPEQTITVDTADGRHLEKSFRYPKGHPKNSFSFDEIKVHFRACTKPYLSQVRIDRIVEMVSGLENLDDCANLAVLLSVNEQVKKP